MNRRPLFLLGAALLALCPLCRGGEIPPAFDATDEYYLAQALRTLKMTPHDLSFSKTNAESNLILPVVRMTLQEPLTLSVVADEVRAKLSRATNLTDIVTALTGAHPHWQPPTHPLHLPAVPPGVASAVQLIYDAALRVRPLLPKPDKPAFEAFLLQTVQDDADKAGIDPDLLRRDKNLEFQDDEPVNLILAASNRLNHAHLFQAFAELTRAVDEAVRELRQHHYTEEFEVSTDTPLGKIIIGGVGRNVYKEEAFLIIDLGGDDVYENSAGGANGLEGRPISIVIDLAGNDQYISRKSYSQGAGIFGIGILVDCGGDDVYEAKHLSQGAGFFGCGMLVDGGGRDKFVADTHAQGAATFGAGILWQRGGDTSYRATAESQGYGGTSGVGLLLDVEGNDSYVATGNQPCPWLPGHRFTLSQGFGYGLRPFAGGGVGILCDLQGDDHYVADVYGQGASYWYSLGLLLDAAGNDTYQAYQYCQGAGIHLSSGALIDWSGNDTYTAGHICQGAAHDYSVGILIDRAGNDHYEGDTTAQGAALYNSFALLLDHAGNDVYIGKDPKQSQAAGQDGDKREYGSIAVLLDLAGQDTYSQGQTNNTVWVKPWYGCGIDTEATPHGGAPFPARPVPLLLWGSRSEGRVHIHTRHVDVHNPLEHLIRVAISDHADADQAWAELKRRGLEVLPYWLTRMDSPDVMVQVKAEALIDYLGTNAVPALIDGVRHAPDDEAARVCCYFLARFESATNAIPVILPLLHREKTQTTALYTLGHLRAHAAFGPAIRFLRDDRELIRLRAAQTLGRIGDRRAIPRLLPVLHDEFWDVRFAAATALGQLGVEKFKGPAGQPPPLPVP